MDVIMIVIATAGVIVALPGAILEAMEIVRTIQQKQNTSMQTDIPLSQE